MRGKAIPWHLYFSESSRIIVICIWLFKMQFLLNEVSGEAVLVAPVCVLGVSPGHPPVLAARSGRKLAGGDGGCQGAW